MSDDEVDLELLELLRKSLGINTGPPPSPETGVLKDAEYICDNSVDIALDMYGTRAAAALIYSQMQSRQYSRSTWSSHELHPTSADMTDEERLNFIFTLDLLNFSFWSEKSVDNRFAVDYKGRRWTGYWSLVAALRRALDEGVVITSPHFWHDEEDLTVSSLVKVFRSATDEDMPMLAERFAVLKEAGEVLCRVSSTFLPARIAQSSPGSASTNLGSSQDFDSSIPRLIESANNSAAGLVNLLAKHFPCFRDEQRFEGRRVRFLKRAQIFVADLWAAFDDQSYGHFEDIDKITMFADYRIPQILHTLGCMSLSPPLEAHIRAKKELTKGSPWESQIRGCSIWAVEAIRREILRQHPGAETNAILIDFFLYDAMQELEGKADIATTEKEAITDLNGLILEKEEQKRHIIPHHRTRSIWY